MDPTSNQWSDLRASIAASFAKASSLICEGITELEAASAKLREFAPTAPAAAAAPTPAADDTLDEPLWAKAQRLKHEDPPQWGRLVKLPEGASTVAVGQRIDVHRKGGKIVPERVTEVILSVTGEPQTLDTPDKGRLVFVKGEEVEGALA